MQSSLHRGSALSRLADAYVIKGNMTWTTCDNDYSSNYTAVTLPYITWFSLSEWINTIGPHIMMMIPHGSPVFITRVSLDLYSYLYECLRLSKWSNLDDHGYLHRMNPTTNVTQRTQDVMITLLLRENDVATSFWCNNDVFTTSCAH